MSAFVASFFLGGEAGVQEGANVLGYIVYRQIDRYLFLPGC